MAQGRCSVQRVNAIEKQSKAWKLRLNGFNWDDIATEVGYKNGRVAKIMVDKYRLKVIQSDKETVENERERVSAFIQDKITLLVTKLDFENKSDFSIKLMAEIRQLNEQYIKINGLNKPQEEKRQEGFTIPITLSLPEGINITLPQLSAPSIQNSILTEGKVIDGESS